MILFPMVFRRPGDAPVPFTTWRRIGFSISAGLLALALGALVMRGLALGLDFTGGVAIEAQRVQPFDIARLRADLSALGVGDAVIQSDGPDTVLVRAQNSDAGTVKLIRGALGADAVIRSEESVGPKVSGELLRQGVLSCLLAVAGIAVYVWLRFEAKFGVAAFVTTFHDVLMMVGLYAVTGMTFDLTSIAALLLIAGYSINDTVVVFDRIRETLRRYRDAPLEEVIDRSISDTLSRTVKTSLTTLLTSLALMALGGPVLFGFAAAVSFGILMGTFSSIFVAAPLLLHLPGALPGRSVAEPFPEAEEPVRRESGM